MARPRSPIADTALDDFARQCARSRGVVDAAVSLDALSASAMRPSATCAGSCHMIEEYARHNGARGPFARVHRRVVGIDRRRSRCPHGRGDHDRTPATITKGPRRDLALISDTDAYQQWWSWLRIFNADALAQGESGGAKCSHPCPMPCGLWCGSKKSTRPWWSPQRVQGDVVARQAHLRRAPERVRGGVGEFARAGKQDASAGLASRSTPGPLGHDWVLDSGARQFVARAVVSTVAD